MHQARLQEAQASQGVVAVGEAEGHDPTQPPTHPPIYTHTQTYRYIDGYMIASITRLHEAEAGEGVVAVGEVGDDLAGARAVGQHVEEGHLWGWGGGYGLKWWGVLGGECWVVGGSGMSCRGAPLCVNCVWVMGN